MLCLPRDVRERVPTGGGRMVRVEKNVREIVGLKITVSGRGDHTRNVGCKAGGINFDYETKTFKCDHGKAVGRRDGGSERPLPAGAGVLDFFRDGRARTCVGDARSFADFAVL